MRRSTFLRRLSELTFAAAAAWAMVAARPAHAIEPPAVVGVHLVSLHSNAGSSAPGTRGWNNATFGLYARWTSGLTVGAFRNSIERTSVYGGWTFTDADDSFALTLAVASGYDRMVASGGDHRAVRCDEVCRSVELKSIYVPLAIPSVRIHLTERTSARLAVVAGPRQPTALHLSFEWKL